MTRNPTRFDPLAEGVRKVVIPLIDLPSPTHAPINGPGVSA